MKSRAAPGEWLNIDSTRLPFPRFASAIASAMSLYGMMVETGPNGSQS